MAKRDDHHVNAAPLLPLFPFSQPRPPNSHPPQETNPFTYVEINGLKVPEPAAAYSLLWEAVSGHDVAKDGHLRVGAKESLRELTRHFGGGGGRGRGPSGHAW